MTLKSVRILVLLASLVTPGAILTNPLHAADERVAKTHVVRLNGHNFTLPIGFTIEQVAGPPLVDRPIVADFDEEGRLYVADSSGSNEKVEVQLEKKPHRIVRLEDSDGDGQFDRSVVFADRMMFPEGTMWYRGSLYVAAPPSIWKLTDTNGDGVADERVEWFQGKTLTGCANDLHGPYLGRDGWIYWAKGAFAKQTYERPGKPPFVTRASHIFRARPDGSGIEPVMTGGMDNPVDVVFTPSGERIFDCTFFQNPGGGRRDAVIHAIYGGVYGKDHEVVYEHKWTSPELMPPLSHLGAAVPAGLVLYESKTFGNEFEGNLFTAQFNLHKVSRHVLEPSGATFRSRDEDFVVSDHLDFHPTDVLEDADGSLLIVDTGGWYKLCCPTSQLDKPDVLGAIYRVRREGAEGIPDPRGRKLDWAKMTPEQLAGLLGDPRPAVRHRAIEALADHREHAIPALEHVLTQSASVEARRNAVWAATRIDSAGQLVRKAFADADETVRQAAAHSVSVRRDVGALTQLFAMLKEQSPHIKRVAAEALGRLGDAAAVPAILACIAEPSDRALDHSLVYALIELAADEPLAAALDSDNPRVRRAALVALDQIGSSRLTAEFVIRELESDDEAVRDTAWWIAGRHSEWGDKIAGLLRDKLVGELPDDKRATLVRHAARLARSAVVQQMLAKLVRDKDGEHAVRSALAAMVEARPKDVPDAWIDALASRARDDRSERLYDVVSCVRQLKVPLAKGGALTEHLLSIAKDPTLPRKTRVLALAASPGKLPQLEAALFEVVVAALGPDEPAEERVVATEALARCELDKQQLLALCRTIESAGPLEVDRLLPLFQKVKDNEVGQQLVESLARCSARDNLRSDALTTAVGSFDGSIKESATRLLAEINKDSAQQKQELDLLMARLKSGDVRRGQAVYHSAKAACVACHAIGYGGGKTGPDLTTIGKVRSDRDLLEAIVFPSVSLVRSYEPVVVITKDGLSHNGLVRSETSDEVLLATGPNQEVRIARDAIEDQQPSKVSIMPAGLDKQLTEQELADLLAFLKSRR